MIDLLIAILIALGCSPTGRTAEELNEENPEAYHRAVQIQESEGYRFGDDGGVVIVESGGD